MKYLFIHIVAFLLTLSPVIFIHELGHYLAARLFGVHVKRFSLGFGPPLGGWKDRHGTHWTIAPFFMGGYVELLGEAESSSADPVAPGQQSLDQKKPWQRIIIALSGPLSNYLLAACLFFGIFASVGEKLYYPIVGPVPPTSLLAKTGLSIENHIVRVQDRPVKSYHDIMDVLQSTPLSEDLSITLDQPARTVTIPSPENLSTPWMTQWSKLGLTPHPKYYFYQPLSLEKAFVKTGTLLKTLTQLPLKLLASGRLEGMGGPIAIARQAGDALKEGFVSLLYCMALISCGLGVLNLLPIPMLDGGAILLEVLTIIRGRPLSQRAQQIISSVALVFLIGLFLYLSWKDILRIPLIARLFSVANP